MRVILAKDQEFVPASHEDPREPGVWKRVIATREQMLSGHPQMINWARLPPGSRFRAHYHEDMEETFIVLRGSARMQVADTGITLGPGDTLVVSPREIHSMQNLSDEPVEYIVVGISLSLGGKTVVTEAAP